MFLTGNSHLIVPRGSRAPPRHPLPAVINLHGRKISKKSDFIGPYTDYRYQKSQPHVEGLLRNLL